MWIRLGLSSFSTYDQRKKDKKTKTKQKKNWKGHLDEKEKENESM